MSSKTPETLRGVEVQTLTHDNFASFVLPSGSATLLTLCSRDDLNRRTLRTACMAFRRAREQRGNGFIMLSAAGYDDDPRELWEIPELCAWLQRFCKKAGLFRPEDLQAATGLGTENAWILACVAAHEGTLRPMGNGYFQILSCKPEEGKL